MWLGDVTVGTDDSSATPASDAGPPNPYVSLAANLVDMLHPYKQGVPVNFAIAPQTQTFLMAGGLLLGGLVVLSLLRK